MRKSNIFGTYINALTLHIMQPVCVHVFQPRCHDQLLLFICSLKSSYGTSSLVNSSGGTSVSSSKSIIGRSNRFDNRDDIGFRGDDGGFNDKNKQGGQNTWLLYILQNQHSTPNSRRLIIMLNKYIIVLF